MKAKQKFIKSSKKLKYLPSNFTHDVRTHDLFSIKRSSDIALYSAPIFHIMTTSSNYTRDLKQILYACAQETAQTWWKNILLCSEGVRTFG